MEHATNWDLPEAGLAISTSLVVLLLEVNKIDCISMRIFNTSQGFKAIPRPSVLHSREELLAELDRRPPAIELHTEVCLWPGSGFQWVQHGLAILPGQRLNCQISHSRLVDTDSPGICLFSHVFAAH